MKHKICVVGAFGFIYPHYDGQTIKSRNLLTLLQNKSSDIDFFEAQRLKKNKFSALCMFWKVIRSRMIFYLPAQNNLTYLFPFIYWLSVLFHTRIHYFVVGGWLVEFLYDKPRHRRKLSKIAGIHCETKMMQLQLEKDYGFTNVDVFPNFRISNHRPTSHHEEGKLKSVFMARVVKMKGIDTIFSLCERIENKGLGDKISIDFYGPQQDYNNDQDGSIYFFNSNLKKYKFVAYYGTVEPPSINSTLGKYDVMLLPTHYYTEGLPGSIIDAYISGIPVVVTKWKYATEFVDDGKTGIIIPFNDDGTALADAVFKLYEDSSLLNLMKTQANKKSQEFSSERAWELIKKYK